MATPEELNLFVRLYAGEIFDGLRYFKGDIKPYRAQNRVLYENMLDSIMLDLFNHPVQGIGKLPILIVDQNQPRFMQRGQTHLLAVSISAEVAKLSREWWSTVEDVHQYFRQWTYLDCLPWVLAAIMVEIGRPYRRPDYPLWTLLLQTLSTVKGFSSLVFAWRRYYAVQGIELDQSGRRWWIDLKGYLAVAEGVFRAYVGFLTLKVMMI